MNRYIHHQFSVLEPYLHRDSTALDFGCGDMALDRAIVKAIPGIRITGIDIVNSKPELNKHMKFLVYNGATVPFKNKSFDVVYAYHVFHHCADPVGALSECRRVAKGRILIVESVLRSIFETPGFMIADFVANVGRDVHIPMPFHVQTKAWWTETFVQLHLRVVGEFSVGVFPTWLPIGKTTLFVLEA